MAGVPDSNCCHSMGVVLVFVMAFAVSELVFVTRFFRMKIPCSMPLYHYCRIDLLKIASEQIEGTPKLTVNAIKVEWKG